MTDHEHVPESPRSRTGGERHQPEVKPAMLVRRCRWWHHGDQVGAREMFSAGRGKR